ncbi:LINE-1 type transposase domain-containing protein 1 [Frankliniella fusca]|uniref:LINE-1 type transposase domain-containing protein 1 n=1 Tax=Frankliniella fusca TaxID=407009 RepID=A0AAE1LEH4_9NEOP|nr:LINE-1 type transposase domain-containing protein 1 [Frankliniella fusca]
MPNWKQEKNSLTSDSKNSENDQLKEKTNDLEQRNRLENLRIFGVSKKDKDTDQLVVEFASKQGIFLERKSISRSHRAGKKIDGKHRAIIVKFVSHADRQKMFLAKKRT